MTESTQQSLRKVDTRQSADTLTHLHPHLLVTLLSLRAPLAPALLDAGSTAKTPPPLVPLVCSRADIVQVQQCPTCPASAAPSILLNLL